MLDSSLTVTNCAFTGLEPEKNKVSCRQTFSKTFPATASQVKTHFYHLGLKAWTANITLKLFSSCSNVFSLRAEMHSLASLSAVIFCLSVCVCVYLHGHALDAAV